MKKSTLSLIGILVFLTQSLHAKQLAHVINDLLESVRSGSNDATAILVDLNVEDLLEESFDRESNRSLVDRSVEAGSPFGKYVYGAHLQTGMLGREKDATKGKQIVTDAIPELKTLAENGDSFACLFLYYIYVGNQSNEGINLIAAKNWLEKGEELGNPVCTYWSIHDVLSKSNDEKEINTALQKMQESGLNERLREKLYAKAVWPRYQNLTFDHIICEEDGSQVYSVFRNELLNCNITLIYFYEDGELNYIPSVYVTHKNDPFNPSNWSYRRLEGSGLSQSIDDNRYMLALISDRASKINEWWNKAREINPPAFTKFVDESQNTTNNSVRFNWDGNNTMNLIVGHNKVVDDQLYALLSSILNSSVLVEDPHSFFMRTKEAIKNVSLKKDKEQNTVNELFQ